MSWPGPLGPSGSSTARVAPPASVAFYNERAAFGSAAGYRGLADWDVQAGHRVEMETSTLLAAPELLVTTKNTICKRLSLLLLVRRGF